MYIRFQIIIMQEFEINFHYVDFYFIFGVWMSGP